MAQTAVITGASAGIGAQTARLFLEKGWNVALIGRRSVELSAVAEGFDNALCLPCDITDASQVDQAFAACVKRFARVDMLFNNAGRGAPGQPIDEVEVATWLQVVNVNLTGAFLCARAAFGQMRRQDPQGGRIINNGSISAHVPRPGSVCYTSTKHAITGLTRTLSLDGRAFNIACGQIDIGNALTEMAMPMTKGVPQANGSIKAEATMDVDHVAQSVLHMAELPLEANVQFMTVMATTMPYIGRG